MPDKAAIHLPSMLTVKGLFERMKDDLGASHHGIISLPQLYRLWQDIYPHVTIPAVSFCILLALAC